MPRYFFNVIFGRTRIADPSGTDLPGIEDARSEAAEDARELMSTDAGKGIDRSRSAAIEVTDEAGRIVLTYPFCDALEVVD